MNRRWLALGPFPAFSPATGETPRAERQTFGGRVRRRSPEGFPPIANFLKTHFGYFSCHDPYWGKPPLRHPATPDFGPETRDFGPIGPPSSGFKIFYGRIYPDVPGYSRVGKVKGGGLNRPQLSVPRFHFAPHRTERTDFPYSALRTHSSGRLPLRRDRQFIESI